MAFVIIIFIDLTNLVMVYFECYLSSMYPLHTYTETRSISMFTIIRHQKVFHHTKQWKLLIGLLVFAITFQHFQTSTYAAAPRDTASVTINGGGGILSGGGDGLKLTFNVSGAGEQIMFKNKNFHYNNGDFGFHLNIGGTLYTSLNGSKSSLEITDFASTFDNLTISNLTGSANTSGATTTGDGSVRMLYSVTVGGLTYTVRRDITYVSPDKFYTDEYTIVIPSGNTAPVVFYKGGDVAPFEADTGSAAYFVDPVRTIQAVDTVSGFFIGMKEVYAPTNMATFDGAVAERYFYSYDELFDGANIGFRAEPDPTNGDPLDIGLMTQHNLGSAAGTYNVSDITYVGPQAVSIHALWLDTTVSTVSRLRLAIQNNFPATKSNVGFTFTLPSGLYTGAFTTTCPNTVQVTNNQITVSGAAMAAMSSCAIDVDIGSTGAGTFAISNSNISGITGSDTEAQIDSNSIRFTSSSPTFTPTLSPSRTRTPTSTVTFTPSRTLTPSLTPTPLPFAIVDMAVGQSFVLGVMASGKLVTWGINQQGQTSIPGYLNSLTIKQVEAGMNWALVLRSDSVVNAWGSNEFKQLNIPAAARRGVTAISAFYGHALALKSDGTVVAWGRNHSGQATVPGYVKNITAISAGHEHSLAITRQKKVIGWGHPNLVHPTYIAKLSNIKAISAGFDHSLALREDGTVACWRSSKRGSPDLGQCRGVDRLRNIVEISAGRQFSVARAADGTVYGWGTNVYGQVDFAAAKLTREQVRIARAGYVNSAVALSTGGVAMLGDSRFNMLVSRTPTSTGFITPSPARATWTPLPPTFTPSATKPRIPRDR